MLNEPLNHVGGLVSENPYRNMNRFPDNSSNSDPMQALTSGRPFDWASRPPRPNEPPCSEAAAAELATLVDWNTLDQDTLGGWVARLLPFDSEGLVAVDYAGTELEPTAMMQTMLAALSRDGAVILRNAIPLQTCEKIMRELAPYYDDSGTLASGGSSARSAAARECSLHPAMLALAEGVLGHQCLRPHGKRSGADWVQSHAALPTTRAVQLAATGGAAGLLQHHTQHPTICPILTGSIGAYGARLGRLRCSVCVAL